MTDLSCGEGHGGTVGEAIARASRALADLQDANPWLEAHLLLSQATGWSRSRLVAWPDQALEPTASAAFARLVERRRSGEPLAYLRGRQAFWTLDLRVTPETLIPRPETELLVEIAIAERGANGCQRVADLGTGSGAIAAALGTERPDWLIIAVERSATALAVAQANFTALGLSNCLAVRADWLHPIAACSLDLILANPPYVRESDPHLGRGDLRFEPRQALTAGSDGLVAIRAIVALARPCLRPGGQLALEHGYDQGPAVRGLLLQAGLQAPQTRRDLAGQERVTFASIGLAPAGPAGRVESA